MPRERTVRAAVLGSSVQRAAFPRYPTRSGAALKRRLVMGVLVALSLLMITLYFRESQSGGMHTIQDVGATALRPFQVAAERVVRPFRDGAGWVDALLTAKSENARLLAENERLLQEAIQYRAAAEENETLRAYTGFRAPARYPSDYDGIAAAVVSRPSAQFAQQVVVAVGSSHGVRVNDPVVSPAGALVGLVTELAPAQAQVTLLSDPSIAVSAEVLEGDAVGLVKSGRAGGDTLVLDQVKKEFVVERGNRIITAGSRVGNLPSLYPRGIPIGTVTFVNQSDTDLHKRIQIQPYVDWDKLDGVLVLVPRKSRP